MRAVTEECCCYRPPLSLIGQTFYSQLFDGTEHRYLAASNIAFVTFRLLKLAHLRNDEDWQQFILARRSTLTHAATTIACKISM